MAAEPPEASCSRDAPPAAFSSAAAAAAGGGVGGPNPCCAKLWKKCQKLETSRTALREAVKLLQAESEKLQKENSDLSKVCKEERLRGDSAEAARATESDARDLLEKELIELKTQNSILQQSQNICKNDNELLRISELEEENRKLKQVLGEERKKIISEKKKAEEEKSKALEMQKVLKSETQKSEEFRRVADTERKVANDWRASCERLRSEANEVRAQLAAQIRKTEEALKRVETEKQTVAREKKRADSEKSLSEKNKTLIEVERKKVSAEKSRADNLFAKLEEQKRLNEHLRTSIQVETKKTIDEKKRADHLFQKLEEEKKQSEYLWRKTNELRSGRDAISSGNGGRKHVDTASGGANVKLLKEKLKLKKEQLKHVKNVSKLDKAKNALIRRELQRLKQDWMQLLSRFNMLDDHLAGGVGGIHVLTELKQHPEIHGGFEQKLLPNDSVPAPYFGLQAGMVPFVSSIPREYASYHVFKQGKLAEDNDKHPERINLCYFTELISLFELFGIYMSCEWTYTNVVVRLLEILESCMCDEFAAALLVLVSQLGRFFVDDVGYEQRRVSEMRDKLSSLLGGTSFTKSRSLSVQFSAIGALLSVIPLPFDSIVATQSTQLSGPFAMSARQISEWFVQLSDEHQSLAGSFFG
nr:unnamed protein product [Digitaria exilis]